MASEQVIQPADRARLRRQLRRVAARDPGIRSLLDRVGYPSPRMRPPGFATLLQIIVSQQVSTAAANAIMTRLESSCRGGITWRKILARSPEQLRACGLSRQKIDYARSLAQSLGDGELRLDALQTKDTDAVIGELVQVRGLGRWSAQIYAMFALGHRDVYPEDDLALQVAIQRHLDLVDKPSARETATIAGRWAPSRSAVALLMWKYYGGTTLDQEA